LGQFLVLEFLDVLEEEEVVQVMVHKLKED
jgi:hypothetical protein